MIDLVSRLFPAHHTYLVDLVLLDLGKHVVQREHSFGVGHLDRIMVDELVDSQVLPQGQGVLGTLQDAIVESILIVEDLLHDSYL